MPVTILNLVRVLGVGRSGKAKKVGVPQRPSEIMANNHIGWKVSKMYLKLIHLLTLKCVSKGPQGPKMYSK